MTMKHVYRSVDISGRTGLAAKPDLGSNTCPNYSTFTSPSTFSLAAIISECLTHDVVRNSTISWYTSSIHFVHTLRPYTSSIHFVHTLRPYTSSIHFDSCCFVGGRSQRHPPGINNRLQLWHGLQNIIIKNVLEPVYIISNAHTMGAAVKGSMLFMPTGRNTHCVYFCYNYTGIGIV